MYHGLDLSTATFESYNRCKYGIEIRFVKEELLPALSLQRHADFYLWYEGHSGGGGGKEVDDAQYKTVYIVPELVYILPFRRNLAYITSRTDAYMPSLERHLESIYLSQILIDLSMEVKSRMPPLSSPTDTSHHHDRTLPSLLIEATSLYPCVTYQRLEFLGDAVLAFFLSIQLFSKNYELTMDIDDLENVRMACCKNVVLYEFSKKMGLDAIIHGMTDTITDAVLADVVESLLAVAFLYDEDMVIALLEKLQLPLNDHGAMLIGNNNQQFQMKIPSKEQVQNVPSTSTPWFTSLGTCLQIGYPFTLDKKWFSELVNIGTILYYDDDVIRRLEEGYQLFFDMFFRFKNEVFPLSSSPIKQRLQILMMASLFDDSPGYHSETSSYISTREDASSVASSTTRSSITGSIQDSSFCESVDDYIPLQRTNSASSAGNMTDSDVEDNGDIASAAEQPAVGLTRVAILRDNLFVIGNAALHLIVSKEIYNRYPTSTSGDMHLLKSCVISDDVLCYVAIKNHLHECLFDENAKCLKELQDLIVQADARGEVLWKEKGGAGWILPNGIDEYRKRKQYKSIPVGLNEPRYVGLAGGRFCSHGESKLPLYLTQDLAFSFKAICGALVLALGLEEMWGHVGAPLFEELLMLSPDELRHVYGDVSSICANYQRGYESSLASAIR